MKNYSIYMLILSIFLSGVAYSRSVSSEIEDAYNRIFAFEYDPVDIETNQEGDTVKGTAVLISEDGYAITARHVLDKIDSSLGNVEIRVLHPTLGKTLAEGVKIKQILRSEKTDIATFKIDTPITPKYPFYCVPETFPKPRILDDKIQIAVWYIDKANGVEEWSNDFDSEAKIKDYDYVSPGANSDINSNSPANSSGRWIVNLGNIQKFQHSMSGGAVLFKNRLIGIVSGHRDDESKYFVAPLETADDISLSQRAVKCLPIDTEPRSVDTALNQALPIEYKNIQGILKVNPFDKEWTFPHKANIEATVRAEEKTGVSIDESPVQGGDGKWILKKIPNNFEGVLKLKPDVSSNSMDAKEMYDIRQRAGDKYPYEFKKIPTSPVVMLVHDNKSLAQSYLSYAKKDFNAAQIKYGCLGKSSPLLINKCWNKNKNIIDYNRIYRNEIIDDKIKNVFINIKKSLFYYDKEITRKQQAEYLTKLMLFCEAVDSYSDLLEKFEIELSNFEKAKREVDLIRNIRLCIKSELDILNNEDNLENDLLNQRFQKSFSTLNNLFENDEFMEKRIFKNKRVEMIGEWFKLLKLKFNITDPGLPQELVDYTYDSSIYGNFWKQFYDFSTGNFGLRHLKKRTGESSQDFFSRQAYQIYERL